MCRQLYRQKAEYAGKQIIQHNPRTARYPAVEPANGPGFENVEEPEQPESRQQPDPAVRKQPKGDEQAHPLIPHDASGIVESHLSGSHTAEPDPEEKQTAHDGQVDPRSQGPHQQIERYRGNRTQGSGSNG